MSEQRGGSRSLSEEDYVVDVVVELRLNADEQRSSDGNRAVYGTRLSFSREVAVVTAVHGEEVEGRVSMQGRGRH